MANTEKRIITSFTDLKIKSSVSSDYISYLNKTLNTLSSLLNVTLPTELTEKDFAQDKKLNFRIIENQSSYVMLDPSLEITLGNNNELFLVTIAGSIKLTSLDTAEKFHEICKNTLSIFNLEHDDKNTNTYIARSSIDGMNFPARSNATTDTKIISLLATLTNKIFGKGDITLALSSANQRKIIEKFDFNEEFSLNNKRIVEKTVVNNLPIVDLKPNKIIETPISNNTITPKTELKFNPATEKPRSFFNKKKTPLNTTSSFNLKIKENPEVVEQKIINNDTISPTQGNVAIALEKNINQSTTITCLSSENSSLVNCAFYDKTTTYTPWYHKPQLVIPTVIGAVGFTVYAIVNWYTIPRQNKQFLQKMTTVLAKQKEDIIDAIQENTVRIENAIVDSIREIKEFVKESINSIVRQNNQPNHVDHAFNDGDHSGYNNGDNEGFYAPQLTPNGEVISAQQNQVYNPQEVFANNEAPWNAKVILKQMGWEGKAEVFIKYVDENFKDIFQFKNLNKVIEQLQQEAYGQVRTGKARGNGFVDRFNRNELDKFLKNSGNLEADKELILKSFSSALDSTKNTKAYAIFILILARIKLTGAESIENDLFDNNQENINFDDSWDDDNQGNVKLVDDWAILRENARKYIEAKEDSERRYLAKTQEIELKKLNTVEINFSHPKLNKAVSINVNTLSEKCVDITIGNESIVLGVEKNSSGEIIMQDLTGKTLDEFNYYCKHITI